MSEIGRALKRLLISTIRTREEESMRISRTLHDDVGQVLSAVGLQLDVLKLDYKQQIPEIVERVDEIQKMLDAAVQQVRTLSYDLNPAVVERAGLQFALDRLVGRFRGQHAISIRLMAEPGLRVPVQVGTAWYKIAEHALGNSVTHAHCTKVELQVRSNGKGAVLEVRDNGTGFQVAQAKHHVAGLGLLLMEHYATSAGLDLVIKSSPAKGTLVRSTYIVPAVSASE